MSERVKGVGPEGAHIGAGGVSLSDDARREFLKTVCMGGLGAGLAAVVAAPAVALVAYPLTHQTVSGGNEFLVAGKLAQFKPGVPVKVELFANKRDAWNRIIDVKVGSAWVIREGDELKAFSTVCPHLGCAVDYDTENNDFKCPCHRSAFSLDGKVHEGPAPRAMDRLEVKQQAGGLVAIRYQRFKQGVAEKESV